MNEIKSEFIDNSILNQNYYKHTGLKDASHEIAPVSKFIYKIVK